VGAGGQVDLASPAAPTDTDQPSPALTTLPIFALPCPCPCPCPCPGPCHLSLPFLCPFPLGPRHPARGQPGRGAGVHRGVGQHGGCGAPGAAVGTGQHRPRRAAEVRSNWLTVKESCRVPGAAANACFAPGAAHGSITTYSSPVTRAYPTHASCRFMRRPSNYSGPSPSATTALHPCLSLLLHPACFVRIPACVGTVPTLLRSASTAWMLRATAPTPFGLPVGWA